MNRAGLMSETGLVRFTPLTDSTSYHRLLRMTGQKLFCLSYFKLK